jgi:hypothetical protein
MVGLGHYDNECFMNAVLDPLDPPDHFCTEALNDMDDIRGYYFRGENYLVVIVCILDERLGVCL